MRVPVLIVAVFLAVVLETTLRHVLRLDGIGGISPSLIAPLAVFTALFASRAAALWTCWACGLLVDLFTPIPRGDFGLLTLIGPHALGFTLGGLFVLQVRTMVFRQRALSLGALVVGFVILTGVVVIALGLVRSWYPEPIMPRYFVKSSVTGELAFRCGIAVYSGLVAIPLGRLLLWTFPAWGFRVYR